MALYGEHVLSLTCDHGKEFANSVLLDCLENMYQLDVYFAHAYAPEERGSNENANGLIRAYLPKKQTFEQFTQADLKYFADDLNNRPRKMHGWKSCKEVYEGKIPKLKSE